MNILNFFRRRAGQATVVQGSNAPKIREISERFGLVRHMNDLDSVSKDIGVENITDALNAAEQSVGKEKVSGILRTAAQQGTLLETLRHLVEANNEASYLATIKVAQDVETTCAEIESEHNDELNKNALLAMQHGRDADKQGDITKAFRFCKEAKIILERLVAIEPNNADWLNNFEKSLRLLGAFSMKSKNYPEAVRFFTKSKAVSEHLLVIEPNNSDWQQRLILNLKTLFVLAKLQGVNAFLRLAKSKDLGPAAHQDLAKAFHFSTEAKTISERLVAIEPSNSEWQHCLAESLHLLELHEQCRNDIANSFAILCDGLP